MKSFPVSFHLQVLLCAVLWGSAFPVIKLSFQEFALETYGEQLLFAGTRFMLAGTLALLFCRRSVLKSAREAPRAQFLMVVLGQTFFQYLFFYYALSVSSATLGALLVGSGSFWWVLLAPVFKVGPFPRPGQWLVLVICAIGIALAVYAPGAGSGNVVLGAAAFLASTLSGAIGAIGMKRVAPEYGSRALTSASLFIGGCLLVATGSYEWTAFSSAYNLQMFGVTIYLAILSATAFTVWNSLIERYSVNVLSAYRFLIPLCGVVEATLFVKSETLGMGIVVGGALVIGSLIAMNRFNQST